MILQHYHSLLGFEILAYIFLESKIYQHFSETEVWTQMVSTELPALAGHAVAISYVKSSSNG